MSEQYSGTSTYKGTRVMGGAGASGNPSTAPKNPSSAPPTAADEAVLPERRPRRKGRGLKIGGIVLIIIGIALVLISVAIQESPTPVAIPAGDADVLTAPSTSLGSASFTVTWTGAATATEVYIITGSPSCGGTPSGLVASGSGSSGSLSASLSSGTSYELYACNGGSPEALSVSYTATGVSLLVVIGIVVAVLGVVLMLLGRRSAAKAAAQDAEAEREPVLNATVPDEMVAPLDSSQDPGASAPPDPSPPPM
ncbi:MAG: hypothetical protein L3K03_07675 [Thermoplasmata archaeon]|nr:hypothetical protein [Thermoplasmata archaeon]